MDFNLGDQNPEPILLLANTVLQTISQMSTVMLLSVQGQARMPEY